MQLLNIAVPDTRFPVTAQMAHSVERARVVHTQELGGDYWTNLGLTRLLALAIWELLELLIAAKQVKDTA